MNENEKVIHRKGLISVFAAFLGLFCIINSVLTVFVNKVDAAGTAELRSGYMIKALAQRELWDTRTDIFVQGDSADVMTDSDRQELIADILEKTADEQGLELMNIEFYDTDGKHTKSFKRK